MKFVVFHGSFRTPQDDWIPYLKTKLEYMDQEVIVPQFPIDSKDTINEATTVTKQNLNSWLKTFENEILPKIKKSKERLCFIGHSLGNVFILHILEKYDIQLDCAIFVSPFFDKLGQVPVYIDKVNTTFYKSAFDFKSLQEKMDVSYVLYSDTDPYVEPHRALNFAKLLDSSHIMIKKAGHLSSDVNLTEFPMVYNLCVSRMDLSLYQKYAYKRQIESLVDSLKNPENKILKMAKDQISDEGTFHYMNLKKGGFATFITDIEDWDPRSDYYEGGRKRAKEGLKLTRVFVVTNPKDLERDVVKTQMDLDIQAGIDVRVVNIKVIEEIGCEPDFGIWDNEYVCIQNISDDGEITDGVLDGTLKTITTAQNWRDRILRESMKLEKIEDLNKFKRD